MTRAINEEGLANIKRWEGLRLTAYTDSVGVWTIGYGHTTAAGAPRVERGLKITEAEAEDILRRDLHKFEAAVERNVKVTLTDNQFAALVSFVYNVGEGNFKKSTLLRKLNAGDYDGVPHEFGKWVNAGGKPLKGLANRRAAEAGLWAKGAFVASQDVVAAPTKINALMTPETIGTAVTTGTGAVSALNGLSGPIAIAVAVVIVLGGAAAVYFIYRRIRERNP